MNGSVVRLRSLVKRSSWRLRARAVDWERVRRRVLALAGFWILLGGMLAALGLGSFVVAVSTVPLVALAVLGAARLLLHPRFRRPIGAGVAWIRRNAQNLRRGFASLGFGPRARRVGGGVAAASRSGVVRTRAGTRATSSALARSVRRHAPAARGFAVGAAERTRCQARRLDDRIRRSSASAAERAAGLARGARGAGSSLRDAVPAASATRQGSRREALRLNVSGAQLRRAGEHAEAAEQLRAALEIVRKLGDRRLEALTLNDLALAVIHSEGAAAAVAYFEHALAVLRELGDDEHEGRVTANLAFAHRRQGHADEAEGLLQAALTKLEPDSSAYRRVEEQLRRAS